LAADLKGIDSHGVRKRVRLGSLGNQGLAALAIKALTGSEDYRGRIMRWSRVFLDEGLVLHRRPE